MESNASRLRFIGIAASGVSEIEDRFWRSKRALVISQAKFYQTQDGCLTAPLTTKLLLVFEVLGFSGTGGPCLVGVGVTDCSIRGETGGPLIGAWNIPVTVVVGLGRSRGLTEVVVVWIGVSFELTSARLDESVFTIMPSFRARVVGDVIGVSGVRWMTWGEP